MAINILKSKMNTNLSPHLYVLTTFLTAIFSFYLFYQYNLDINYFFIPIITLAILYGCINFIRQYRSSQYFTIQTDFAFVPLLRKSIARYLVWLFFIYTAYQFYQLHPFYSTSKFQTNLFFFEKLLDIYLIAGLPYFFITLIFKSSRIEDFYDPAVRIIHIVRQISLRAWQRKSFCDIFSVMSKKYNRKVLLVFLMRGYFIPIMIIQVYGNLFNAISLSHNNINSHSLLSFLFFTTAILWLMDTINASLAYALESRWIENRSRSIDLTIGGWLVCLACYEPLNMVTATLFPWPPSVASLDTNDLVYSNLSFLYAIKIIEIIVLAAHIYTDVSLGPSVANITLKKLQTKGFYGIVRHPATTLKLLFFLIQSIFYKRFYQIRFIYGYFMWGMVYIMRAFTEERHLSHFEEYREYRRKVKYRFIPKIF